MESKPPFFNAQHTGVNSRDGAERANHRRRLLVGVDVAMMLAVVIVIGVLASVLTSTGEKEMLPTRQATSLFDSPVFPLPKTVKGPESALEHGRQHMQEGYRCPFHSEVISGHPGDCPVCGEPLVWISGEENGTHAYVAKRAKVVSGAQRTKAIIMLGSGWVDRITVKQAGDVVTKGQLLMEVYSPDLKADKSQDSAMLRLYSPIDGVVRLISVQEDKFISSGTAVMQIQDSSSVWLNAPLAAEEVLRVSAGQRVEAVVSDAIGDSVVGEVNDVQVSRDGSALAWLRFDADADVFNTLGETDVRIYARPGNSIDPDENQPR